MDKAVTKLTKELQTINDSIKSKTNSSHSSAASTLFHPHGSQRGNSNDEASETDPLLPNNTK